MAGKRSGSILSRWAVLIVLALGLGLVAAWLVREWRRPAPVPEIGRSGELPELAEARPQPGDWPWWRGPFNNGHAPEGTYPTEWGEHKNVLWKQPVPGRGHSSPIVVGNHIYLTSADEAIQRQFVLALDRRTGKPLWETTVHEGGFMPKYSENSHASATPACDGERVFASFANAGALRLTALDFTGKLLWQTEVGPHGGAGSHGSGPSPVLCKSFVIVNDDSPAAGYIAAVHRQTGEIVWRKPRRVGMGSYGSPLVAEWNGRTTILLSGNGKVVGYDPDTGETVWECGGLTEVSANTVTVGDALLFASSGAPSRRLIAVRPDGSQAWKLTGNEVPYPPSMIYDRGHLYVVSDSGRVNCFDAATGEQVQNKQLHGKFWSSPLLASGNLYACNADGTTVVLKANPEDMAEVRRNKLDGGIYASPAAADGKLFLRTETHLYCIGGMKSVNHE